MRLFISKIFSRLAVFFLLTFSHPLLACPVCFAANPRSSNAYLIGTFFMMGVPILFAVGLIIFLKKKGMSSGDL